MSIWTRVSAVDRTISAPLKPLRHKSVIRALGTISDIGKDDRWLTCCAVATGVGLLAQNARLTELGISLLAASKAAFLVKNALKDRIVRTRPYLVDDGRPHRFGPGVADVAALNAFPSGHSAAGMVAALLVTRSFPTARRIAWAAGGFLALIQLPRRHHYPSDVLTGMAIGLLAGRCVKAATRIAAHSPLPAAPTSCGRAG